MKMKSSRDPLEPGSSLKKRNKLQRVSRPRSITLIIDAGKVAYTSSFPEAPAEKTKVKHGKYDGLSRRTKRRRMAIEADEADNSVRSNAAAIRAAKKGGLPKKISEPLAPRTKPGRKVGGKKKKGSAFEEERGARKHEGMRAKRVKVSLDKKGKPGKGKGKGKGKVKK